MPRTVPLVVGGPEKRVWFGNRNPLGQVMGLVGEYRFRIVGVMKTQGQDCGLDPDKVA
ncbi:hypothetical protein ACTRXD_18475 [Nitrospira sp. T9]|uniref:hypothetical protein n=1 Tax=unclassified Nitrospira TaxID=2652172 RepID=UPI003F9C38AF